MSNATWWDLLHDAVVQEVALSEGNLTFEVEIRNLNRFFGWNESAPSVLVFSLMREASLIAHKGARSYARAHSEIGRLRGCWILDVVSDLEATRLDFHFQGCDVDFDWWQLEFAFSGVDVWMPDGKIELDEALTRGAAYWDDFASRKCDDLMP
jgi:hypothetical protein